MKSHDESSHTVGAADAAGPTGVLAEGTDAGRRRFLGQAAATGLVLGGAGLAQAAKPATRARRPPASPARKPGRGAPSGGGAIEADRLRRVSGLPELYPQWNHINFNQFRIDENQHVEFLLSQLGSNARPRPTFRNLEQPTIQAFAETSFLLENTDTVAYLGAAPFIFSPSVLAASAAIATVEARHSGYLGALLNRTPDLFAKSFDTPLPPEGVASNAAPFLVSLNGGPDLTYSTTPSTENDIAIMNFALALEYLGQDYYNINLPKFFG